MRWDAGEHGGLLLLLAHLNEHERQVLEAARTASGLRNLIIPQMLVHKTIIAVEADCAP